MKDIDYDKVVHVIMEGEQFKFLLLTSWKPQNADDVIQFKFKSLRTRELNGVSLSPSEDIII